MTLSSSEIDLKLNRAADALWAAWSNGEPTSPVRELMDGVVVSLWLMPFRRSTASAVSMQEESS